MNTLRHFIVGTPIIAFAMCCYANALGSQPLSNEDAADINASAAPQPGASQQVEQALDQYFLSRGIDEGVAGNGGKVYYRATEPVSAKAANPAWVKSRLFAFEKALLKAQSAFIFDRVGTIITNIEKEQFEDQSSNNRDFPEKAISRSRIESLWEKAAAVSDAKLNALLDEAGVDSQQYDVVPPEERKTLFVDSFLKTSLKKAMGETSGLLPVQTFEGSDDKGNHAIGVVMLHSNKLRQLASDMASRREPFLRVDKGRPLSTYIDISEDSLAYQFGVRVVFDENGDPMVLSFGQWGFGYSGVSDSRLARLRGQAGEQADTMASEALAVFMNSRLAYESESERGEITEGVLIKKGEELREEEVYTLIDKMSSQIKQRASARLGGTRVVKRWSYKHPYGHEIIGRIRLWSFSAVESANDYANFKPRKLPNKEEDQGALDNVETQSGVKPGVSFDDAEEAF